MQLGSYTLGDAQGTGPHGAIHDARTPDGRAVQVRFLDQVRLQPEAWAKLTWRLGLLKLLNHPNHLRPFAVELAHDPPYIVVPHRQPWNGEQPTEPSLPTALLELLVQVHRLGLTLGGGAELQLCETEPDWWVLDLTETLHTCATNDPADDVARLGDLLLQLLGTATGATKGDGRIDWMALVSAMRTANAQDRPLAEELFAKVQPFDPLCTIDTSEVDAAVRTNVADAASIARTHAVPQVGQTLGRFILRERLGEGAVGVVFRADDQADGRAVALKVLKPAALASERARRRFVKEGRLLAPLDTPFVTRLLDVNTDGGIPFIALELVRGQNLGDYLRANGPLPESMALRYIADAARGLAAAHALGIVHRDVKPDNMLLTPDDRVKMTDFGMARAVEQSQSLDITHDGATLGTPLYMAPEQFGSSDINAQADVYSLGASLFHLLVGKPPFVQARLTALAKAIATEAAPRLDRLNATISMPVADLVARTLAKDPLARPRDAAEFLQELERLQHGMATPINDHPFDPETVQHLRTYVFTWELRGTPAQVWPHVSNTERLNRAIGMPAAHYDLRANPHGGTHRHATGKALGMAMAWEEHPFEWIEGRRMGILREFQRGPFAWFVSTVDLTPSATGGTTLQHTLRVQPRGWLGKILAPLQMKHVAKKVLGNVYAKIDHAVQSTDPLIDPFEGLTTLTAARRRLLAQRIDALTASGVDAQLAQLLLLYLAHAPAQEVARLRPLAVALRFGVAELPFAEACLRAVGHGLLVLQWDIICPLCRIPSARKSTLGALREHEQCPACDRSFVADFANAVELVFHVHPEIRPAEFGTYCAGGPAHSPHVVAQARVAPGETIELELHLSEGGYRLRGPQLPWSLELLVKAGAGVRQWEIPLGANRPTLAVPPLAVGLQRLQLHNSFTHEVVARIERTAVRPDALTAARAMTLPAFRELFPGELLHPGQLVPASTVTLLLVEVCGIDERLHRDGEAQTFQHVQSAFQRIEALAKQEGGTVIKSLGDGLLLSFAELAPAVRTALACGHDERCRLRAALQRGMVYVATVDDRLDYFGHTVKQVGRFLNVAQPGELVLSVENAGHPDVAPRLATRRLFEFPDDGRSHWLCRCPLRPST